MEKNKLKTKTPNELFDWVLTHKTMNKRVRAIWKRFVLNYLKNENYNVNQIFDIINNNNLGETLTSKILFDLEVFFQD